MLLPGHAGPLESKHELQLKASELLQICSILGESGSFECANQLFGEMA